MTDEPAPLPQRQKPPDFTRCEYVSSACAHRRHDVCDDGCRWCGSLCLCVCHRWAIPVGAAR